MISQMKSAVINGFALNATVKIDMESKDIEVTVHDGEAHMFIDSIPVNECTGEFITQPTFTALSDSLVIHAMPRARSFWSMNEKTLILTRCDIKIDAL